MRAAGVLLAVLAVVGLASRSPGAPPAEAARSVAPGDFPETTELAAGDNFTLALLSNGRVIAWGQNDRGQLGDGTRIDRSRPVFVKGLGGKGLLAAKAITAGRRHAAAVRLDGTVVAWGDNVNGQLGDGTTIDRVEPVRTRGIGGTGLLHAKALAAGQHHTLALRSNGTVAAWGRNAYGQLGDGTTEGRKLPVPVVGLNGKGRLTHVVAIDAGVEHSVALRENRTVATWGYNFFGQLGDGTVTLPGRPRPGLVKGLGGGGILGGVKAIASGAHHILVLNLSGAVLAWGRNESGQLGDGTTVRERAVPVQVQGAGDDPTLVATVAIAAGFEHSLAVRRSTQVLAWGGNGEGQLGIGERNPRVTPVHVRGIGGGGRLGDVTIATAGLAHSVVVRKTTGLAAWGDNAFGQVGDGTTADRLTPASVQAPE